MHGRTVKKVLAGSLDVVLITTGCFTNPKRNYRTSHLSTTQS